VNVNVNVNGAAAHVSARLPPVGSLAPQQALPSIL
jgi:hypothetical protein